MAVAITHLGNSFTTLYNSAKTVVATPAAGSLIVIIAAVTGNTAPLGNYPCSDDNSAGVYASITGANPVKAASVDEMLFLVRTTNIASAVSTTFTLDATGLTNTGGGFAVFQITGLSRTGLSAIKQSAAQNNQAAAGTPTPTFGAAPLTGNAIIEAVFNATNPATMTPRTSFTEAFDIGYATPTTGFEAAFRNSGETTAAQAWGGTSASAFCSAAIELDASSPDVTLALTGQSITSARGSLASTKDIALTGQGIVASRGSVLANLAVTFTTMVTNSVGITSLATSRNLPLSGQATNVSLGTITAVSGLTLALTGQGLNAARGTLTPFLSVSTTGQFVSISSGSVSPMNTASLIGKTTTVNIGVLSLLSTTALTGQSVTTARGNIIANNFPVLTGQSLIVSEGILSLSSSLSLLGQNVTSSRGIFTPAYSLPISGNDLYVSEGFVIAVGGNVNASVTGQVVTTSLGNITASFVANPIPRRKGVPLNQYKAFRSVKELRYGYRR